MTTGGVDGEAVNTTQNIHANTRDLKTRYNTRVSTAALILSLAILAGAAALSGLVCAIIGVSRRQRWLLRTGIALAVGGLIGFALAGTITLTAAMRQARAADQQPEPTTLDLRQWFRISTGATLPAESDPLAGVQGRQIDQGLTYYLVIAPSPALDRLLARDFTPASAPQAQPFFAAAPAFAAWNFTPSPTVRYFQRTYESPSRANFVAYVALDGTVAYFVGVQTVE